MADIADIVARKLAGPATALGPQASRQRLIEVANRLKPVGEGVTPLDLGADGAFSHWKAKAGGVIPLAIAYSVHKDSNSVTMHRGGKTAGMWRVAESGRKGGMKGERRLKRRYTSKKTGEVKESTYGLKRNNGSTDGKGTWRKADQAMSNAAGPMLTKMVATDVMTAFFKA